MAHKLSFVCAETILRYHILPQQIRHSRVLRLCCLWLFLVLFLLLVLCVSVFVLCLRDKGIELCTGPLPVYFCGHYSFGPCMNQLISLICSAWKHVERPGESHTALEVKKITRWRHQDKLLQTQQLWRHLEVPLQYIKTCFVCSNSLSVWKLLKHFKHQNVIHDVSLRSISNYKFWMTFRTLLSLSSLRDKTNETSPINVKQSSFFRSHKMNSTIFLRFLRALRRRKLKQNNPTCRIWNVQIWCQPSRMILPSRWKTNSLLPMQKRPMKTNGFISP